MSQKSTMIPKRIAQIRFGLMDPIEIRKMSAVEVKTADTYKDDGHAYRQGLMTPTWVLLNLDWFARLTTASTTNPPATLVTFNSNFQSCTLVS